MSSLQRVVRRNTFVLAASLALSWSVIQIMAAMGAVTFSHLAGDASVAGFAPGVWLLGHAAGGYLIGRGMDAWGRRNGLIAAFLTGAAGITLVYLAIQQTLVPLFVAGLVVAGVGTGGSNLARAAGADMYPPERRARGITLVLLGAAFGAIGSPLLFAPMLAGARAHDAAALAAPWPLAALLMLAGAGVLMAIRTDPREIARSLAAASHRAATNSLAGGTAAASSDPHRRPLRELIAQPMVPLALMAALVSQAVMTATMSLAGLVLVGHGHDLGSVSLTMSAHFLGMFGLVLVVGSLVDRVGRFVSIVLGLVVLAGGVLLMLAGVSLVTMMPAMFAIGVGWNISFVASTAVLADAAGADERGRLLGFSDTLSIAVAAGLSVAAGLIIGTVGLSVLVVVAVSMALLPAVLIALNRTRLEGRPA